MITVNLDKAKDIAHTMRRSAREAEFAPHDAVIALRIPGANDAAAEAARLAIRKKYAAIQKDIDLASDVDKLKDAVCVFTEGK